MSDALTLRAFLFKWVMICLIVYEALPSSFGLRIAMTVFPLSYLFSFGSSAFRFVLGLFVCQLVSPSHAKNVPLNAMLYIMTTNR